MDETQPSPPDAEGRRRRSGAFWRAVSMQPRWVIQAALTAFLVIIAVPVAILICVALLVAAIVFGVLTGIRAGAARMRSWLGGGDGRRNVRVIGRHQGGP